MATVLQPEEQREINFNVLLSIRNNLKELEYREANGDFLSFIKKFAPLLVSDFKMGKHIEVLADKLQQVEDGNIKRLMVFYLL